MAMPWYAWAAIGVGGIVVVAIIANAASAPAQPALGDTYTPPVGGGVVSTETAVVQGAAGLLTAITGGIFAKVGRDDAARESALERADRLHRDEADRDEMHRNEDLGLGR